MKILFFSDNFYPETNAAASHVYERAVIWQSQGHEVTVICSAPNFPEGRVYEGYKNKWRHIEYKQGVRVVRVKTFMAANTGFALRILDFFSFMVSSFFFSFFEKKPDIVISTSPHLLIPIAGVFYAIFRRVTHIFELRDLWPASMLATGSLDKGFIYSLLERIELFLYGRSKKIIAFTESFKTDLVERGIAPEKIDVVVNGANLKLFSKRNKDKALIKELGLQGHFIIGYIGTHGLAHGLSNVIEAARTLPKKVTFLFVGAGADKEKIQNLAQSYQLKNVLFVTRQPKEKVANYWSICDVALVHLRDDPLFSTVIPSKIFEAMAMGLPILYVAPEGEGSKIIQENKVGLCVEANNPEAMVKAIKKLRGSKQQLTKYAKNALKNVNKYSRENQAAAHMKVFESSL